MVDFKLTYLIEMFGFNNLIVSIKWPDGQVSAVVNSYYSSRIVWSLISGMQL
jgi:hypothetical protein